MTEAELYAWACAEDMRGWAQRAEAKASALREENYALRREVARLRDEAHAVPEQTSVYDALEEQAA